MSVSNGLGNEGMTQGTQFRKLLPISQTVLAIILGGCGLWLRNSVLSRPLWGNSTGWESTLRFHYWPWPFKFAAILNMPAFLASWLLSRPLDYLRPGLPEWASTLPVLLFIPLLWYWVGAWADKNVNFGKSGSSGREGWILLLFFVLVCAAASSIPDDVAGYTGYVLFGIAIWLVVTIGVKLSIGLGKRKAKVA
jgi:hypothetical protein